MEDQTEATRDSRWWEQVGERHSSEDEEREHHWDEEDESKKQGNVQGPESERGRRVLEPSPTIPSRQVPHDKNIVAAN